MKINTLWKDFINYGYRTRINKLDGLKRWNEIKVLIPDIKLKWTDKSKKFYDKLVAIRVNNSESSEDAKMDHTEWERHHYLLQHGRIIKNNHEGSLLRLLQIAYNCGQFKAESEKKSYPKEQIELYIKEKMNELSTFIKDVEINIDNKELLSKLKIGGKKNIDSYLKDYLNKL
jgi:hypothetical protein